MADSLFSIKFIKAYLFETIILVVVFHCCHQLWILTDCFHDFIFEFFMTGSVDDRDQLRVMPRNYVIFFLSALSYDGVYTRKTERIELGRPKVRQP